MSQISVALSNISKTLSDTSNNIKYSTNSIINSNIYGIPLVTIGLIGVTSIVLAYVTIMESDDSTQGMGQNPTQGTGQNPISSAFNNLSNPLSELQNKYTGGKTKKQQHKNRKTKSKKL